MCSRLPYFIANAFTDQPFGGNPAAVMLLEEWLSDDQLLSLAAQHNLSETAFLVKVSADRFTLRWFTPTSEVPLCGHATLAAAHVLKRELGVTSDVLQFETCRSGTLTASEHDRGIAIDLPATLYEPHSVEPALEDALGAAVVRSVRPAQVPWQVLYELESERAVRALAPNISALASAVEHCVIATARGRDSDFVSRMFAPQFGVDEDPVTGSAHCILVPFWAAHLRKSVLWAEQCSARGGTLHCTLRDDRVTLAGQVVTFAKGEVVARI